MWFDHPQSIFGLVLSMQVDVVILTKNCADERFERCLFSVKKEVPVDRLIIVDGYSTDETVNFVKKVFPDALIIYDDGTRATARQKGIEAVETEWFAFIDSDVVLRENWFSHVKSLMGKDVGGVQGAEVSIHERTLDELKDALAEIKRRFHFPEQKTIFPRRAFTGDTLIRTQAVKGIRIPPSLHVYEDRYIQRYVQEQGFEWRVTDEKVALHYGKPYQKLDLISAGTLGYLEGYLTVRRSVLSTIVSFPKGILVSLFKGNLHFFAFVVWRQFLTFVGVLKGVVLRFTK